MLRLPMCIFADAIRVGRAEAKDPDTDGRSPIRSDAIRVGRAEAKATVMLYTFVPPRCNLRGTR